MHFGIYLVREWVKIQNN